MAQTVAERSRRYRKRIRAKLAGLSPEKPPGPDPASCDPITVLRSIAVDPAAPATARVAAAKALLLLQPNRPPSDRPSAADRLLRTTLARLGQGSVVQ